MPLPITTTAGFAQAVRKWGRRGSSDEYFLVVTWDGLFEVKVQDERTRRLAGLKRGPVAPVGEVLIKAPAWCGGRSASQQ
ncbi:MAG: hypothetical protein Kow0063_43070 [Anaerolineae bacterium]